MRSPILCILATLTAVSVSVSACAPQFSSCSTSYDCCEDLLCMKVMDVSISGLLFCIQNSIP
ncbi:hypothetical protein BDR03DRAFT_946700 [Suillus americanus]|nr:hypothetical protein BDR03DRAFT_946700 [Suillus americanus]